MPFMLVQIGSKMKMTRYYSSAKVHEDFPHNHVPEAMSLNTLWDLAIAVR